MVPPPGVVRNAKLLRLDKELYSCKEAPLAGLDKLGEALAALGFISLPLDPRIFISE